MPKNLPGLTVVITTCYGEKQILQTIKSLKKSIGVGDFPIILVADRMPVPIDVKKELKKLKVKLVENSYTSSAFAKFRQIYGQISSDIVILTQDDVLFEKDTLKKVVNAFESDPKLTFVGIKNTPLKPLNLFERAVNVGTNLNNAIAKSWNDGDNYLAVLGRLMAFKSEWLKKNLEVYDEAVSLDAYLYLENLKKSGKYKCIWDTTLYFRNPQNMSEHMKKSSRFQNSKIEMTSYGRFSNLEEKYKIPLVVILQASLSEFLKRPIDFILYIFVYSYTRIYKSGAKECLTPIWDVDLSTKVLN